MCLGSGSSGNCYFFSSDEATILIDAGIGPRSLKKALKDHHIDLQSIQAIFITHDHADHIKAVGNLAHHQQLPVYATPQVHEGMQRSYCMTQKLEPQLVKHLYKETPIQFHDLKITCFEVPHDSTDNVGYFIEWENTALLLLTDMGHFTPTIASYVEKTDYLIIEANYDDTMLANGPYPKHLKERIASDYGHMCNREAAAFLANHIHDRLKRIWLCHLSKDNNHPDLAFKTVELALREKGIVVGKDVVLETLRRTVPSPLYGLDF